MMTYTRSKTSCQTINDHKECIVCDSYHRYTLLTLLLVSSMKLNVNEVVLHIAEVIYKDFIRQTPFSPCVFIL